MKHLMVSREREKKEGRERKEGEKERVKIFSETKKHISLSGLIFKVDRRARAHGNVHETKVRATFNPGMQTHVNFTCIIFKSQPDEPSQSFKSVSLLFCTARRVYVHYCRRRVHFTLLFYSLPLPSLLCIPVDSWRSIRLMTENSIKKSVHTTLSFYILFAGVLRIKFTHRHIP